MYSKYIYVSLSERIMYMMPKSLWTMWLSMQLFSGKFDCFVDVMHSQNDAECLSKNQTNNKVIWHGKAVLLGIKISPT